MGEIMERTALNMNQEYLLPDWEEEGPRWAGSGRSNVFCLDMLSLFSGPSGYSCDV